MSDSELNNPEELEQHPTVNTLDVSNTMAQVNPVTGPISDIVIQDANNFLPPSDNVDVTSSPTTTEKETTAAGKLIHNLIFCLMKYV